MKTREPRHDVQLPARLRGDDGWADVAIRNVSSHGMMLLIKDPPERGTYIEVRRGSAAIVGRVMWTAPGRCGLRTKEKISVAALAMANAQKEVAAGFEVERRAQARTHNPALAALEAANYVRTVQFAAGLALLLGTAAFAAHKAHDVLARPSAAIAAALG